MEILITNITVNPRGQTRREQRRVSGTVFRLGRGSECEVHLPDSRIALIHAQLTVADTGAAIEVASGQVLVNGRDMDRAELTVGDRVEIGPYQIEIEPPPENLQLALSVRLATAFGKEQGIRNRIRVRAPKLSIRRLSYLAFVSVVALFLVLPVLPDVLNWEDLPSSENGLQLKSEVVHALSAAFVQTWNPGPLSRSHQVFGKKCEACHARPFIQVRDRECIGCHKAIREHVPRPQDNGVREVALRESRCAECHRDHKNLSLTSRAQSECVTCHRDPGSSSSQVGIVTDFGSDHPQYRLSMFDAAFPEKVLRVRQGKGASGKLTERSNLKFNHKLHMDPAGVRDPKGKRDAAGMRNAFGHRTVLTCESCHERESDGRLMAPVSMERHCQSCHSLAFEPTVTARQVPHGSEEAISTMLREFYSRLVLGDAIPGVHLPRDLPRVRPGTALTREDSQRVLRIADRKVQQVLRDLYDRRQVCSTCHFVTHRSDVAGWVISPVAVTRQWMPRAVFNHAKHASNSCAICHDVARSTVAEDVAMPDIAKCRECHVGSKPVHNRVTSDCVMCHKFHAGTGHWDQGQQAPLLRVSQ